MTKSTGRLALGLDLGGSAVKVAVIAFNADDKPEIMAKESKDTHPSRAVNLVIDDLVVIANEFRGRYGTFDSIGLGLPGIHNQISGRTTHLPNFPIEWEGFPLQKEITARIGQPVTLANDGRAFSVAEAVLGSAAGFGTVVCVVLGTGVGGGVVIDGKLWKGTGTAGELGHQSVAMDGPLCGCGNRGCVEMFAGSTAITNAGGKATVREVFEAALAGDGVAKNAVDRAISALAAGLANAYVMLAPDAIVVGGGVADAGAQLMEPLISQIRRRAPLVPAENIRVFHAQFGVFAGAVGAALIGAQGFAL